MHYTRLAGVSRPFVDIVEGVQQVRACRDPDDDKFLEAAVNGRADVVVSGEADLLALPPISADPDSHAGSLRAP